MSQHQPRPPGQPPVGWIRLTISGNAFSSSLIEPIVRLNGYPVQARYGESVHPVPPGSWHLDVHCQWMRQYGQGALDVDVAEGQVVDVYYAPPWHQFARGRIGLTRQTRPGVGCLVVMLAVLLLIVVGAIAISL